ncbi:DUF2189 domain-containing protein [Leeia sp.]|uniref:DUF2189 domain-containing protein n=1 Tax=Leeia sp. TaxID=2884678 RepID=UPI0035B06780
MVVSEEGVPPFPSTRNVPLAAPLGWLSAGWQDLRQAPLAYASYGLVFALSGAAFWLVLARYPEVMLGLVTGFMLIGPFLAIGTYHLARQQELGEAPSLKDSLTAWRANLPSIGFMVMIEVLLMASWIRVGVVLIALFFEGNPPTQDDLLHLAFYQAHYAFVSAYVLVGAGFAALVFMVSVVSIPLLMDRKIDAISAIIVSVIACGRNPGAMLLWGMLIVAAISLGFLTGFVGLILTAPWIGAASWHAYRGVLLPER